MSNLSLLFERGFGRHGGGSGITERRVHKKGRKDKRMETKLVESLDEILKGLDITTRRNKYTENERHDKRA
jgi:hypothetical protein